MHVPFSSRKRLPGLYKACDFVALPSHFDGMPNVLLEAMALGVVPIVSDAGAMGDIVEDGRTGFVFPADDRQAGGCDGSGPGARRKWLDRHGGSIGTGGFRAILAGSRNGRPV
jgi:glycosyltransferase involved in cell wall biosynthesis